ncbi:MAG: hypothetical protein K2K89_09730 [Ruminococcus sp.]|nr:hypothetical protein [Ruminococcus sp.]
MAIFKNRHYGNFTQIDNAVIHSGISPAALGALVMLLSHGANWNLNVKHFQKEMGIGERATRTIINELTKIGHIDEIKDRDQKGRYKPTTYNIYETPKTKQENQPEEKKPPVKKDPQHVSNVDNPYSENQHVDNDGAIPYYNNKEAIKKEAVKTEAEKAEPARLPHVKHQNVFLTDDEYKTLVETYGKEQTDYSIDTLSDFKQEKPNLKNIKDFKTLMTSWIKRDIAWGKTPQVPTIYRQTGYRNKDFAPALPVHEKTMETTDKLLEKLRRLSCEGRADL